MVLVAIVQAALLVSGVAAQAGPARPRYSTAPVQRGEITAVVYATGALQPVMTVPVSATVAGKVARVKAGLLARVRSGEVLAELDPAPFDAQVSSARQRLAETESRRRALEANLVTLQAAVQSAQSNLERLQAAADESRQGAARAANLLQQGVLPQNQHDLAQASLQTAEAKVREGGEQLRKAQAQLDQTRKEFEESQSGAGAERDALEQAERNLRAAAIRSPLDGIVVACNTGAGQDVTPEGPALFSLAENLRLMRVAVRLDHADAARITIGAVVTVQADSFPSEKFRGRISGAAGQSAEGSAAFPQTETIVEVDNPEERLLPGGVAYVTIPTRHAAGVLKIPNAALSFSPSRSSRVLKSLYEKNHIPVPTVLAEPGDRRVVWRLTRRKALQPVAIKIGITDHSFTELLEGNLKEGDFLITAEPRQPPALPRKGTPRSAAQPAGKKP